MTTQRKKSDTCAIGDVVKLRSGGPWMTVTSVTCYGGVDKAQCIWFRDGGLCAGGFDPRTLILSQVQVSPYRG
jgi:uncharacterized protein YodC (DUF2158 family)